MASELYNVITSSSLAPGAGCGLTFQPVLGRAVKGRLVAAVVVVVVAVAVAVAVFTSGRKSNISFSSCAECRSSLLSPGTWLQRSVVQRHARMLPDPSSVMSRSREQGRFILYSPQHNSAFKTAFGLFNCILSRSQLSARAEG